MSTSEHSQSNDFERWIADEFASHDGFTALVVLAAIAGAKIEPLCSTYLNVMGADVAWADMAVLFAGAGADWNGAAFFPARNPDGTPLDNPTARLRLRELEERVDADRRGLEAGHLFDRSGRRLTIGQIVEGCTS